jgi:hypothetical protein
MAYKLKLIIKLAHKTTRKYKRNFQLQNKFQVSAKQQLKQ